MRNRLVWEALFVAAALGVGLALSWKPWRMYLEQRAVADRNRAEMRAAEKGRAELARAKAEFESPGGRERAAREQGYRKPGEVPAEGGL
jgi:hypothetical protein